MFMKGKCLYIFFLMSFFSVLISKSLESLDILFVVGYFPAPSETFILNQIIKLIDRGHNVYILSFHKNSSEFADEDIKKYRLLDRTFYGTLPRPFPHFDIIFCQFGYHGVKMLQRFGSTSWLKESKLITCFRGSDITTFVQKQSNIYNRLFKNGDLFLPVCEYFKNKLIKYGCDSQKIVVHHSAIDCSRFFFKQRRKPDHDKISFISVGRLVEKKGLDDAISAIAKVYRKYPNIEFIIVGDGPERPYLEKIIKELKMSTVIKIIGWAKHEDVVKLLNKAHIFILPSVTSEDGNEEGIPNSAKEAMAMGVLPVITKHAGNPELVEDGVSGFLVPERNPAELANKIIYLIEHPEIWHEIAKAGRKKVENEFEINKTIEKLERIFYRLLGKKSS